MAGATRTDDQARSTRRWRNNFTVGIEVLFGIAGAVFGVLQLFFGQGWLPEPTSVVVTLCGLILMAIGLERLWIVKDFEEEHRRVWRRLRGPNGRAYLTKDATYLAATNMLVRAEHDARAGQRILITDLPGTVVHRQLRESAPEKAYDEQWQNIIRGGRGRRLVRQIVNVADQDRLQTWLERVKAFEDVHEGFEMRAHAHREDLPHADILAVSGIGALIGFRGTGASGDACAIRLDGAAAFQVAENAFDLIWDSGTVIFKNGRQDKRGIAHVEKALAQQAITIINGSAQLFRGAEQAVERARQRIWVTSMGRATGEAPEGFAGFLGRVAEKLEGQGEIEFRRAFHVTRKGIWDGYSWKTLYRDKIGGSRRAGVRYFPDIPDVPAILLTDREVIIAVKDAQSDDLRRGVILGHPDVVDMFSEWYRELIWQAAGHDIKLLGETAVNQEAECRVEDLLAEKHS